VDRRSDIFAVGLVFYELLAYRPAFAGETAHSVIHSIVNDAPRPIAELCPDIGPELGRVIAKAIQKHPDDRYQTLNALAADVVRARDEVDGGERDQATVVMPVVRPGRPAPASSDRLARRRAEVINERLDTALRAFAAKDYDTALAS